MKAICDNTVLHDKPELKHYLESSAFEGLKDESCGDHEKAAKLNLMTQFGNLISYPFIKELYQSGELKVHLWIYDLKRADVDVLNLTTGDLQPISYDYLNTLIPSANFKEIDMH